MNTIRAVTAFFSRHELKLFLLMGALHLIPIWISQWFYTFDGPAHLYNARQLWEILVYGNDFLTRFYAVNSSPDNWLIHGSLMLLQAAFGMAIAEKLLLTAYIVLFTFGFRRWMHLLGSVAMSWWVFFLLYFYNFYLGQYSFAFSLALFPWFMSSWQRWLQHGKRGQLISSGIWLLLLYLTHIVSFGVASVVAGILALGLKTDWVKRLQALVVLGLIALPGLFFAAWFMYHNVATGGSWWMPLGEKVDWLFNFRSLIVFHYEKEGRIFGIIAWAFWAALVFLIWKSKRRTTLLKTYLFALLTVLLLYLLAPDVSAGGGYIITRLNVLVLMLLLATLAQGAIYYYMLRPAWIVVIGVQLYLLNYHTQISRDLGKDMVEFQSGMAFIEPNSVVIPLNYSPNWMHQHLGEATGFDRPMVNLANYEASNAYFPLAWQRNEVQNGIFAYWQNSLYFPPCSPDSAAPPDMLQPDYFVRWCYIQRIPEACDSLLNQLLATAYDVAFVSSDGRLEIFEKKRP